MGHLGPIREVPGSNKGWDGQSREQTFLGGKGRTRAFFPPPRVKNNPDGTRWYTRDVGHYNTLSMQYRNLGKFLCMTL